MKSGKYAKNRKNHDVIEYNGKRYNYDQLYNLIKDTEFKTVGDDVDYKVTRGISLDTNKPCVFILFEETTTKTDWKNNFLFFPKSSKAYKGWKHKLVFNLGFFSAYQSARDEFLNDVINEIYSLPTDDFDIIVCGFSYGATITQIACEDIYEHFNIKPIFIGYEGANPCSNHRTKKYVENILNKDYSIMFVNQNDIVPRCPPFPFGRRIESITYYMKHKLKYPFLFPLIRSLIDSIKNTEKYHTKVDEAIKEYMEVE